MLENELVLGVFIMDATIDHGASTILFHDFILPHEIS